MIPEPTDADRACDPDEDYRDLETGLICRSGGYAPRAGMTYIRLYAAEKARAERLEGLLKESRAAVVGPVTADSISDLFARIDAALSPAKETDHA